MNSSNPFDLKHKYLNFFLSKNHKEIEHTSLVPENDPSTLFTGSGMQPMIPYLLGASHPAGKRLVNVQRCFRSQDFDEVGDNRHTTFFEMLGNWSLGDYFKEEQLTWIFEFLISVIGLAPSRLYVSVFNGFRDFTTDFEAIEIWKNLFASVDIKAEFIKDSEVSGLQHGRIFGYGPEKNWWSRMGTPDSMPIGEPGGSDSELFYDLGAHHQFHEKSRYRESPCHINCDCGRFVEIGNNVFMQYRKVQDQLFKPLQKKNIDFGGGFERMLLASENKVDVFSTTLFQPIISKIESLTNQTYDQDVSSTSSSFRIIADHIRASVMLIGDDVTPSNKEQGYVVRRLLRRAIRHANKLTIKNDGLLDIIDGFIELYKKEYPHLSEKRTLILNEINGEQEGFKRTLSRGLKELDSLLSSEEPTGQKLFFLYETYGLPLDVSLDVLSDTSIKVDETNIRSDFNSEQKRHSQLSKVESSDRFSGGLLDHSHASTCYHTATHLLLRALQLEISPNIHQYGSNITPERMRYDINLDRALSDEEIKKIEALVNEKIERGLVIESYETSKEEALNNGVEGMFWERYPERVKVYTIKDPVTNEIFSKELCGGPHVENSRELQKLGKFKIVTQENLGKGKRRIRAQLLIKQPD